MSTFIFPPAPTAAGAATEITLLQVEQNTADTVTELQAANVTLTSLDGKDYSTETTLAAVLADTSSLDAKDFATETTLQLVDLSVQAVKAAVQAQAFLTDTELRASAVPVSLASVPLPTGAATETTLADVLADTSSLDSKDFATETTLSALEQAVADKLAGSLINDAYDYISLAYKVGGNGDGEVETVVYKSGGSGGTTVGTLGLIYDSSNRVISVTKT